ncbi:MAG: response regulator [Candidatus Hydrogenedentes bacterium]|nr:response regulator [Candidatus Hydrogenedentota bacterium]
MARISTKTAVILLVEDDPADQELTRRALEEGKVRNTLQIVSDGEQALDYLFRRGRYADPVSSPRPDLILLDLNLPKLDGRQVLENIRVSPELRRIAIVVLTTSNQEEDIVRSYDLGANSYITKPVDLAQFLRVVQALQEYWFEVVVLSPDGEDA